MILPDLATVETATFGGILIGAASAGLLLVNGRIAGITGILGEAVNFRPGLWRWAFLGGLAVSSLAAPWFGIARIVPDFQTGFGGLALAGLLVGFGTRLSNGCTSGHGVCGLSNLSLRSLVATSVFMAVGALTVFAVRHLGVL